MCKIGQNYIRKDSPEDMVTIDTLSGPCVGYSCTKRPGIVHTRYMHDFLCHFALVVDQLDDELPPVPDSVHYLNSNAQKHNDQHCLVQIEGDTLGINVVARGTRFTYAGGSGTLGINLDPEDAIQLAYDIKRIARKMIKERDA